MEEAHVSGKPFEQTQGWNWIKLIHPQDQENLRKSWVEGLRQKSSFAIEARVWHEGYQQYRWFSHRAVPVFKEGVLTGWVGASIDIHESKELEQALRASEHRFRVALASAPLVVFTMDQELRYTWIYNPKHNLSEEAWLGNHDDQFFHPGQAEELTALKQAVLDTGQAFQREIKLLIDGSWFNYIVALEPVFDHAGMVMGLVGASLDVTEQRRLEAARQETELQIATQQRLLETRENERGKIARDIHDGPVQTLVGAIFNLYQMKEDLADQQLKTDLETIEISLNTAVHELRQVINELRPPSLSRFGLVKAIHMLAEEARGKKPDLALVLDLDKNANRLAEPPCLPIYRVCQEALNNIVRHSQATRAEISLALDTDHVILEVVDNGIGFACTNDLSQLTQDHHFGLAGMKERVEAVNGSFQFFSAPGSGTKIIVRIPQT